MTSSKKDLLIEIGTEELPPKALLKLSNAFSSNVCVLLRQAKLGFADVKPFATPRRLALLVSQLETHQASSSAQRRGPAITAAYDSNGNPTPAAVGFAKSCGVDIAALQRLRTDKGEWLVYDQSLPGASTASLIPALVKTALDQLPIPKRMRWGSLDVEFVRPVHWIILLFGTEIIKDTLYSVTSGNETRGHRFHHPEEITISTPDKYEQQLNSTGKVIADFDVRKNLIRQQVEQLANQQKAVAVMDEDLLDEVTSMVEWPQAILGHFDQAFLEVPPEALISTMKSHQKYFHLVDAANKLLPSFITISNINSLDPEQVRRGNERVIRPRLSDAQFFWRQDRKQPLFSSHEKLKSVVFQAKLGTLFDKTLRCEHLAAFIAKNINADPKLSRRAALLAKCDLMSHMVNEFPELQGIMGRYYATLDKEDTQVADAIEQHYRPRFAGDILPTGAVAQTVALADKLDTLIGIFGLGLAPTGDKDPFGLRRAALGCIRILIELDYDVDILLLLNDAQSLYKKYTKVELPENTAQLVFEFVLARLEVYYTGRNIRNDLVEAVLCLKPTRLSDAQKRIYALVEFSALPDATSLAAANKRISNILKKVELPKKLKLVNQQLVEPAEKELANALEKISIGLDSLLVKSEYAQAMKILAELRQPVDVFFDNVMVMVEDENLKQNRLLLLKTLRDQFLRIADISRLQF